MEFKTKQNVILKAEKIDGKYSAIERFVREVLEDPTDSEILACMGNVLQLGRLFGFNCYIIYDKNTNRFGVLSESFFNQYFEEKEE